MADIITGGNLAQIILAECLDGESLTATTKHLHTAYGVEVSVSTLSKWVAELTADTVAS